MKRFVFGSCLLLFFCLGSLGALADEYADESTPDNADENGITDETSESTENTANAASENAAQVPREHAKKVSPYRDDQVVNVLMVTSAGRLNCELLAGNHPYTVMNFVGLATGKPGWKDSDGHRHEEPYYQNLKFGARSRDAFVASENKGVDFVIPDERCSEHQMVPGALAMVQTYPGMAAAQFILAARNLPEFKGMFTVFGHCEPLDVINVLTKEDAVLEKIEVVP